MKIQKIYFDLDGIPANFKCMLPASIERIGKDLFADTDIV